jgi:hypothetical protein
MGKLTRQRYAALDALISERGEDWMHEQLMQGISEGVPHTDLAGRFGLPWWLVREWIEANCAEDVALAYRARADLLSDAADRVVAQTCSETVQADKFQAEHWMKQAGRFDSVKYGSGEVRGAIGGVGGITIVIGEVRSERLPAPKVVDGEVLRSGEVVTHGIKEVVNG